jgi:cell wall-associated NlpC family hydrolase
VTHARNQGTAHDYRQFMDEARAAGGGAYQGDFSGVTGYDDPSPGGADEQPLPGNTQPAAFGAPAPVGTGPDADTDRLPDQFEMSIGTDPRQPDTDHDGLTDGFEVFRGTNPLAVDTDGDGLSDLHEVQTGSDPVWADTDVDGVSDAYEIAAGRDPIHGIAGGPGGSPGDVAGQPAVDSDGDGLSDVFEAELETSPHLADSDGDTVADGVEYAKGTDPLRVDSGGGSDDTLDNAAAAAVGLATPGVPGGLDGRPGQSMAPAAPFGTPGVTPDPLLGTPPVGPAFAGGMPGSPAAMAGGAPTPDLAAPVDDPGAAAPTDGVRAFLDAALEQTGDPYIWASEAAADDVDPDAFDCSELTQWAASRVGVELPDGSWLQYLDLKERGAVIPVDQAIDTPGALLFHFDREPTAGGGRPSTAHVAISMGDGTTIEARGTRYGVGSWEAGDRFDFAAVIPELSQATAMPATTAAAPGTALGMASLAHLGPSPDSDVDGLPDTYEMSIGTDPHQPDTDRDSLSDGFESFHGTSPLAVDTDSDGLSDGFETQAGTNPLSPDTDGDGMIDGFDVPAAPGAAPGLGGSTALFAGSGQAGAAVDSDDDGLSDAWEPSLGTNPLHADSDADGAGDADEVADGTDPLTPDADDDSLDRP